jgi:thioredoxin-related protein
MLFFKQLVILLLFSFTISEASTAQLFKSLGYSQDYAQGLEKAKKSNKVLMLVISEKTCPWCRKLEQQVLKRKNINEQVQKDFVGVGLEKNDDVYPKKFTPKVVPTVVFVNPNDERVIFNSYGYKPKKEFATLLEEVNLEYKKAQK